MKRRAETRITLDVRTKLLVMLAVLSLPLLIISLFQLHTYQRSLNEQARAMARAETLAAARALEEWVEANPDGAASPDSIDAALAHKLYEGLRRHGSQGAGVALSVFNPRGEAVPDSQASGVTLSRRGEGAPASVTVEEWNDGVRRVTGVERVEPGGWGVAVGIPLPENTPAGRSILILTATWAATLLASSLLAYWAVGRFTTPLRRLASSASTLGEGNLRERAAVETDDEVGMLAGSFNQMAASLEGKFEELRQQGVFIGEVLDSLPLGVVVLDSGLVVRKVNAAFARMVGRDAARLTGRGLYEAAAGLAILSEVVEDVRRSRRAFVNYGQPLELVAPKPEGEGQKFWDLILWPVTEQTGSAGSLILVLSEVSKRVRAEKLASGAFAAEKARAAELESVIKQMDEGVVIVDSQGRYRINPAGREILGRAPAEFRDGVAALVDDMALLDLSGSRLDASETPICRALREGEHVSGQRLKIMRGDGEERVLAVGATPLVGDGGRREGAASVFRDITEEVRHHEELVSAYDRLREHDRLKSAFVANMSHELRTPLNVIIGLSQILRRDPQMPLAPLQSDAVARMERNARALLDLVNDMLDYSRLEAGRSALRVEPVNVAEVAGAVAEEYAPEMTDKGVKLRVEVSPELGAVMTDRLKLRQVLSCLVSNAIKFTSAGTIVVSAAPVDDARWYVEVSDTGIGMSSDALTYIFDGFRQVDDRLARSYSGVGLGLAIARKIVELLDGDITVESREGEGSRFRITWPRAARARTGTGSLVMPDRTGVADIADWRARVQR
jgi:PAS domain S-box-containing protein